VNAFKIKNKGGDQKKRICFSLRTRSSACLSSACFKCLRPQRHRSGVRFFYSDLLRTYIAKINALKLIENYLKSVDLSRIFQDFPGNLFLLIWK
jgi:hypothetical protein